MPLIPSTANKISDPEYWKEFYRKHPASEWFGNYNELAPYFERYVKPSDRVLEIGCGNSKFATQLYDNGFRNVVSIDVDESVIRRQIAQNAQRREGLVFQCASALELPFEVGSVNVVMDKGTLDDMMPPDPDGASWNRVVKMMEQVAGVLAVGGRYVVASMAQAHILGLFAQFFSHKKSGANFMVRVHGIESTNVAGGCKVPVFLLIATKLRSPMPVQIYELMRAANGKSRRYKTHEELCSHVASIQAFYRLCIRCEEPLENEISMDMRNAKKDLRFRIWLLDNEEHKKILSYAAFVIPLGRESEWLHRTEKGRRTLLLRSGQSRLAVIVLFRGQEYKDSAALHQELNRILRDFVPPAIKHKPINFLSLGAADNLTPVAKGVSEVNGEWIVEDINLSGHFQRRLIFGSASGLIQSESKLMKGKRGKMKVDHSSLMCSNHSVMLSAFAFLPSEDIFTDKPTTPFRIAILGLGGGQLATFIIKNFPTASVVAVELDPAMKYVATKYFAMPDNDPRLKIEIIDALDFLEKAAKQVTEKTDPGYDVILMDLSNTDPECLISAPSVSFIEEKVFDNIKSALKPHGVFAMNVVAHDANSRTWIKQMLAPTFSLQHVQQCQDDAKEVVICPMQNVEAEKLMQRMEKIRGSDKQWMKKLMDQLGNVSISAPIKL